MKKLLEVLSEDNSTIITRNKTGGITIKVKGKGKKKNGIKGKAVFNIGKTNGCIINTGTGNTYITYN